MGTDDNRELVRIILGPDFPIEFHAWDGKNLRELTRTCHIGIAPLFGGDDFSGSKPPNKAIIMNYSGLPVVAGENESNRTYLVDGVNGFIAKGKDDWYDYILKLILDEQLRSYMSAQARRSAGDYMPSKVSVRLLKDLFESGLLPKL